MSIYLDSSSSSVSNIKEAIRQVVLKYNANFDLNELEKGLNLFELKTFKAKQTPLIAGEVCDEIYFSFRSIVRCFYQGEDGNEHTLWMKPEQTFITEYKSYVGNTPSAFSLQFYEESQAYCIKRSVLMDLYAQYPSWAIFGINLTEAVHVTLIDVFVNLLSNDATRNYRYIEYAFPRFLQVAPLKDIASMLQISPVSLSRIRAGKQTKM